MITHEMSTFFREYTNNWLFLNKDKKDPNKHELVVGKITTKSPVLTCKCVIVKMDNWLWIVQLQGNIINLCCLIC